MRFDLTDLSLFRNVVEAGSITAGAERSHLALAAASTRIRHLEETLGTALLLRSRQGVTATNAGRALLQHARTILVQTERLREDMSAFAGGLAGQIRILSNTNALTEFLPEALSQFLADHPQVSIDLEERLSDEIVGLIAEGVAEIGIVSGTVDAGSLVTFPFRSDRFVLVVARDHPLAGAQSPRTGSPDQRPADGAATARARLQSAEESRFETGQPADGHRSGGVSEPGPVSFAQVLDHDFIGLDRASALQRFLAGKAARLGRPIRLRVQLRSFDGVCRLVECGVGVGIVPETTARRAAKTMAIAIIGLSDPWAERDLNLCIRDMAKLSPLARDLVEHLRGR